MMARLPPNALVRPPERMMPRTVNALSPTIVDSVSAIADVEAVPLRELVRDDDRIGLREKDERVVDDRLVAALEVVVAQAAIAGHVDAENQDVALARQVRRRRRFDDGHGDLHLGNRLHALEHLLGKSGLAGRHLQLGRAGDAIDRSLEREEHRLIRRVHARRTQRRRARCPTTVSSERTACFCRYGQLMSRSRRMIATASRRRRFCRRGS